MPLDMPYEDLLRDLKNTIVIHKNKPVFVQNISRDGDVSFVELISREQKIAPFTLKSFLPPTRRLGMINVSGSVAYMSRIPVRKFFLGLSRNNTSIELLEVQYPNGAGEALAALRAMNHEAIGLSMFNKYPTFKQCVEYLLKFKAGAMAFDKQFCLSAEGYVFYKMKRVGRWNRHSKTVDDIVWDEGSKHLQILLKENYEEAARHFAL